DVKGTDLDDARPAGLLVVRRRGDDAQLVSEPEEGERIALEVRRQVDAGMAVTDQRRDLVQAHNDLVVLQRGDRRVEVGDGARELLLRDGVVEVLVRLRSEE